MRRNALNDLIKWNNSNIRKPLIVWGARQVGKTYLVKDMFAEEYYKNSYVYVDFRKDDDTRKYCMDTVDAKKIIEYISASKNIKIDNNTLLIFDEIQECPSIITSLKYFCQDYREIPVIATGSMVRIKLKREAIRSSGKEEFLFPVGKIDQLQMYPMSFDEFLENYNKTLYDKILEAYQNRVPLETSIHKLAIDSVYKYLLVGGMPEAVDCYIKTESYYDSRQILKSLYDNYLSDMELYQASRESINRSKAIFANIFNELNKESKNFKSSMIEKNARTRDLQNPIDWLITANIIQKSFQLKDHITLPLYEKEGTLFRLFLCDIGMFTYQSGVNSGTLISNDRSNTISGIFFENFVANELVAKGNRLFYWKGKSAEFEFIVQSNNNIFPIDVKKKRGNLNSLEKYKQHNKCDMAIKVSENNYGFNKDNGILTIPFYQFPFLANDISQEDFDHTRFIK